MKWRYHYPEFDKTQTDVKVPKMRCTTMKYIYAVDSQQELDHYQSITERLIPKFEPFLQLLQEHYQVNRLPEAIILTSAENATKYLSHIPVPAYTNEIRTIFTPDLNVWKVIYKKQLEPYSDCKQIAEYYDSGLSERNILQILGHEMVHHSQLFLSDFDDEREQGIWFEEGMSEYLSRRYFLTSEEYDRAKEVNRLLVEKFFAKYGAYSLEDFGAKTYVENYASIFASYWRSFLAVDELICRFHGNVFDVFSSYHQWSQAGTEQTLEQWFGLCNFL